MITLVKSNQATFIPDNLKLSNVEVKCMFQDMNKAELLARSVLLNRNIGIPESFYNRQLKNMDTDLIIVTDCHLQTKFVEWLHRNNPNTRLIVWYWNTIKEVGRNAAPDSMPADVEKWSYSKYDCDKFNLHYNSTYYPHKNKIDMSAYSLENDVYFIGKDKGRLKKIVELKNWLEDNQLKTEFHICPTHKYELRANSKYKPPIPYSDVLIHIAKSRAIIDISVSETAGPTIRPMEALFYQKKLITDNKSIMNERYYCKENIFIIGIDSPEKISDFVRKPYLKLDEEIANYYSIEQWLARFNDK